jgi:trans-2,3-dihydro-3-hydroxyanthranilate isomerase
MAGARRYSLLDVFTDTPLCGNPLAVFADGVGLDAGAMQRVARELNLSETVFVLPARAGGDARVRIFTPAVELPFAGHPVLGAAVVVADGLGLDAVTLETGAGPVAVERQCAAAGVSGGWMAQPLPTWGAFERTGELLGALGVASSLLPVQEYVNGPRHVFVALEHERAVAALAPDMGALAALGELCVSCFAGSRVRWKTRMFAPGLGVPEDPATGSAAGPLAVHLLRGGRIASGAEVEIRQGEELARPSLLRARAVGSAESIERVEVGGSVVAIGRGELWLG